MSCNYRGSMRLHVRKMGPYSDTHTHTREGERRRKGEGGGRGTQIHSPNVIIYLYSALISQP